MTSGIVLAVVGALWGFLAWVVALSRYEHAGIPISELPPDAFLVAILPGLLLFCTGVVAHFLQRCHSELERCRRDLWLLREKLAPSPDETRPLRPDGPPRVRPVPPPSRRHST